MKKLLVTISVSMLVLLSLGGVASLLAMHPWVQLQLVRRVFETLAERSDTEIEIREIRAGLSGELRFAGLKVQESDGRTMLQVERGELIIDLRALLDRIVDIGVVSLTGVQLNLRQGERLNITQFGQSLPARSPAEREFLEIDPWSVRLRRIVLTEADVTYREAAEEPIDDPLWRFYGVNVRAHDLEAARGHVALDLRHVSFRDFNGLSLDHGELLFTLSEYEISVDHLLLTGGESTLRGAFSLVTAPEALRPREPQRVAADSLLSVTVYNTRLAARDLQSVMPFVPAAMRRFLDGTSLSVSGSLFGTLDDLQFPMIDIGLGEGNRLTARGELRGLLSREEPAYRLVVEQLEVDREQLRRLGVDDRALAVPLPAWMRLSGSLRGTLDEVEADFVGDSSAGEASFRGEVRPLADAPDRRLGVRLAHTVRSRLTFRDELDVSLDLEVNQQTATRRFRGEVKVARADLQTFGLAHKRLVLSGDSRFDVSFDSPSEFRAGGDLTHVVLREEEREHRLEELSFLVSSTAQQTAHASRVSIESDILTLQFRADLAFDAVQDSLRRHVARYFARPGSRTPERPDGSIELEIEVFQPLTLLVPLVPELSALSALSARLVYEGSEGTMQADARIEEIAVAGVRVVQLNMSASTGPRVLLYEIAASRVERGTTVLHGPTVRGDARANTLSGYLTLDDEQGADLLRIGARARLESDSLILRFDPQRLSVRSFDWQIADDHLVVISDGSILVENLRLTRDQAAILIDSRRDADQEFPPLDVRISDLELATIIPLLNQDADAYSGMVSGTISVIVTPGGPPIVTAALGGRDLVLARREIGQLLLELDYERGQSSLRAEVSRGRSLARAEGWYRPAQQRGELEIELAHLDIEYLSGYIPDELTDTSGYVSGTIRLAGTPDSPQISGRIGFRDTEFSVTQLGTSFAVGDEVVEITRNTMRFVDFSVRDRAGNRAVIHGEVALAPDPADIMLDLSVSADRFTVLNTTARQNPRFHGRLVVDSDLQLSGPLAEPRALGSVGLLRGSAVTFVLPDPGAAVGDAEGVIRFRGSQTESEREPHAEPARTVFRGANITANLQVDPSSVVELIVDERSGDRLRMRGGGELSLGIDPSGMLSLSGRYEISEGGYVLSFYNITRREFAIVSGSNVVWTGDPFDATLDISASYTVRTSVAPLLAPQAAIEERAPIVGELPFQVILSMQGRLMQPEIDFSLDMPVQDRAAMGGAPYAAVQQINQQESRRNTQAFALIVLNQFVADDFGGIDEAAVVAAGTRSSASQLLTYQLNALSQRVIPGVDLTFEVESYEEFTERGPEGRTEVGVQISQRLLDERLIVRFGGQFDVEGERSRETGFSEIVGDLSIEYLLTADGRYRIRGFREQAYQGPVDGALTTTGVSFVFRHEFDRLPWSGLRAQAQAARKRDEEREAE